MQYIENMLHYEDYCKLRESVGWLLFSKEQTQKSLDHSLYTVIAVDEDQTVGMGRLIGDGTYFMLVDIVVQPNYQKQAEGTSTSAVFY